MNLEFLKKPEVPIGYSLYSPLKKESSSLLNLSLPHLGMQ